MPKIILLDGLDGTGKHTIFKLLQNYLIEHNYHVHLYDFPAYGTPTGKLIKEFLHGNVIQDVKNASNYATSLLYTADRLVYYENHKETFGKDDIILYNRSYMSNFFYQTAVYYKEYQNAFKNTDFHIDYIFYRYIDKIKTYLNTFYELEIRHTFLDNKDNQFYNFYLYHPNIEINFSLAKNRGDMDLYEKDKEFQLLIHENALMLYKCTKDLKLETNYPAYLFELIACSKENDSKPYLPEFILKNILLKSGIPQ